MSSFMQNLTDGLNQAGQALGRSGKKAAAGVQTAAEIAKLNWQLDDAKKEIEAAYSALGKAYFVAHGEENGTEFEDGIIRIRRAKMEVERLEKEIGDRHTPQPAPTKTKEESREEKRAEEVAAAAAESEEAAEAVEAAEHDEEAGGDL